jgi:hypothetical protein
VCKNWMGAMLKCIAVLLMFGVTLAHADNLKAQRDYIAALPDQKKTTGANDPDAVSTITDEKLCSKGFTTKSVRNVSEELKAQVYASYGMKDHVGACHCPAVHEKTKKAFDEGCEVDHLVSLEIGGTNDIKNLWVQPYCGPWNAHIKDTLENELHKLVCAGTITGDQARKEISIDWVASYKKRCVGKGTCSPYAPR